MTPKKYQHGFRVRFDGNQKRVMEVFNLLKKFCKEHDLNLGFYSQTGTIVKKKKERTEKKKKSLFKRK